MSLTEEQTLYNAALDLIGEYEVSESQVNMTSTKQYTLCARNYARARDETLVAHLWNEAVERDVLVQETTEPLTEFDYKYALPSDCLRVISIGTDDYDWQVEGGYILTDYGETPEEWEEGEDYVAGQYVSLSDVTYLCNVSNTAETANSPATDAVTWTTTGGDYYTLSIKYIKQLTTISSFSPKLYNAIAYALAIKIVTSLTGDMRNKVQLVNEFEQIVMPQSRSIDAMQGKPRNLHTSTWLNSRY